MQNHRSRPWDFDVSQDFKITATPNVDEMLLYIQKCVADLRNTLDNKENEIFFRAMPEELLKNLVKQATFELKSRIKTKTRKKK